MQEELIWVGTVILGFLLMKNLFKPRISEVEHDIKAVLNNDEYKVKGQFDD